MKGAIFVLFLLSNNWNFFQKTSNITTNIYLYINISNITTNIYLSLCDQDSAMPKSNSNLHHSIECAQIDNSTLLKIENWWLLRVHIPLWSHGWKSSNFAPLAMRWLKICQLCWSTSLQTWCLREIWSLLLKEQTSKNLELSSIWNFTLNASLKSLIGTHYQLGGPWATKIILSK